MSRTKARESLSMADFGERMSGVYASCVCEGTIDESLMAYKDGGEIARAIRGAARIADRLRPVYNYKAAEAPARYSAAGRKRNARPGSKEPGRLFNEVWQGIPRL